MMFIVAQSALAHGDATHTHGSWWTAWNWDPLILASLAVIVCVYLTGLVRMWSRAGEGHGISRWQAGAFAFAMIALVIALISPLDPLSDELSYAHMIQHMTLMMIAAPLFVLGAPMLVMLWAIPDSQRRAAARWMSRFTTWRPARYVLWQPIVMWSLYAFTLWIWHLPAFYEAALRNRWIHEFQHITFFVASCLFWRVLIDPLSRRALNRGIGVLYLFLTSLHATLLGVFMALAPRAWYADYIGRTEVFNLTALEDQQIAGFIMWMPACTIYAVVAAAIFALWIREPNELRIRTQGGV